MEDNKKENKSMRLRMAILSPADIAVRRFLPALKKCENIEFAGVGVCKPEERNGYCEAKRVQYKEKQKVQREKAAEICKAYGGRIYDSMMEVILDPCVDAIYIALPPQMHYEWARKALEMDKHVFMEKPFAISLSDTKKLIDLAREHEKVVYENYMFLLHSQLITIKDLLDSNSVGDVRLMQANFGFPKRKTGDFRYNKTLGGGSLLDAGGYAIKLGTELLGESVFVSDAMLNYSGDYEVDLYGSGTLRNVNGAVMQIAFGMDNDYRCSLNIWGSEGTILTNRIFTAPDGYEPEIVLSKNGEQNVVKCSADDSFMNSINYFLELIENACKRSHEYTSIMKQAEQVEAFMKKAAENYGNRK